MVGIAVALFGMLGLPAWSNKLLFAGLVLVFVPALIFSWVYELTPEGLKREHEIERNASITAETARKLDLIVVGLLGIALPILPGLLLVLGGVLLWALMEGTGLAWGIFAASVVVAVAGRVVPDLVDPGHPQPAAVAAVDEVRLLLDLVLRGAGR